MSENIRKLTTHFEMNLWHRIRVATIIWWAIVVTGEIECSDDCEEENVRENS